MPLRRLLPLPLLVGCLGAEPPDEPPPPPIGPCAEYASADPEGQISAPLLDELSGLVVSRQNPGVLWVHEDSGGAPELYALDRRGTLLGALRIEGVENLDWEDLALGPCGEEDCLFIADTGDNLAERAEISILRVLEPRFDPAEGLDASATPEVFRARYPDGPQDAEALVVTPDGAPVVLTKRLDATARVFLLPALDAAVVTELLELGVITTGQGIDDLPAAATAADLLAEGARLLVRTYLFVWELELPEGDITRLSEATQREVPAAFERQGEAIAYDPAGGFWQVGEGSGATLFFSGCAR